MNATVRTLLEDELKKWLEWREEKVIQINNLRRQLLDAEGHLKDYEERIAAYKQALEDD